MEGKCLTILLLSTITVGATHVKNIVDPVFQMSQMSQDPGQDWAYVTVRPKAHMFYWLYQTTDSRGYRNRPLILWLQGGPGGSGTGFGNFGELGPLDTNLQPRNTTWLQTASLLFIDNPVGSGYSYVEDESAYTTNVAQISSDLLMVMKSFMECHPDFQGVPFYIFSESYGGKMTAAFSAVLFDAIKKGDIKMHFEGFAMGDSWISPVSSTNSWGPFLQATSLVDLAGYTRISKQAAEVADLVKKEKYEDATTSWSELEGIVEKETGGVSFYNILDWGGDSVTGGTTGSERKTHVEKLYDRHVKPMQSANLDELMNGPIRKKLKIIPDNIKWGAQSGDVFKFQVGDFMRNVTHTVNDLINNSPLRVIVYSGQLDLICNVLGTEAWFYSLDKAKKFQSQTKSPYQCAEHPVMCYYGKKLGNLQFYWVLDAGHMVPQDNGSGALAMVNRIIGT